MKGLIFPKNIPIDESRIDRIEKIVGRLARRSKASSTALITPFPVSNAVFGDGISGPVLRYLFPCEGKIKKGMILFGKKPQAGVKLSITVSDDLHSDEKTYTVTRKSMIVSPDFNIDSGDRLEVSVYPISEEDNITEVWISFLWVPSVNDIDAKSYLMEEMERDLLEEKL